MQATKQVPLQAWLKLLCQMIPGISQAVLLNHSASAAGYQLQWPEAATIHEDVISAAKLAHSQKKSVTTMLSSAQGLDAVVETVIALPVSAGQSFNATLSLLVRVKPSQQAVVMQIVHWGELWLELLLQQPVTIQPVAGSSNDPAPEQDRSTVFRSSRSYLLAVGVMLLVVVLSVLQGTWRVSAPASLEGSIQRVIIAPFDGYIANAFARSGETVKKGDIIAELDNSQLLLKQQGFAAEKNEHTREYRQALGARDKAQAHIFKSQINQAEAQLQLLQKKLERSTLVAPLDGIIISGDLSRSLGAPVETGDILFEIAPLDEYRLIIFVPEKEVAYVQPGQQGELSLKARPSARLSFEVSKVSPVFEENESGIAYRVEAALQGNQGSLRPGMQGVAKIDIDQRSYLWIYLHDLYDAIRLWLWSWLP